MSGFACHKRAPAQHPQDDELSPSKVPFTSTSEQPELNQNSRSPHQCFQQQLNLHSAATQQQYNARYTSQGLCQQQSPCAGATFEGQRQCFGQQLQSSRHPHQMSVQQALFQATHTALPGAQGPQACPTQMQSDASPGEQQACVVQTRQKRPLLPHQGGAVTSGAVSAGLSPSVMRPSSIHDSQQQPVTATPDRQVQLRQTQQQLQQVWQFKQPINLRFPASPSPIGRGTQQQQPQQQQQQQGPVSQTHFQPHHSILVEQQQYQYSQGAAAPKRCTQPMQQQQCSVPVSPAECQDAPEQQQQQQQLAWQHQQPQNVRYPATPCTPGHIRTTPQQQQQQAWPAAVPQQQCTLKERQSGGLHSSSLPCPVLRASATIDGTNSANNMSATHIASISSGNGSGSIEVPSSCPINCTLSNAGTSRHTIDHCSTPLAHANGDQGVGSSNTWRPGIWSRIWASHQLQVAVRDGDVQQLCHALHEPGWHIQQEVHRLRTYFALTFHFRLVLEQCMVLDWVSTRTLQQLPQLPPDQLHLLDIWLAEDLNTYLTAAVAAAPESSRNNASRRNTCTTTAAAATTGVSNMPSELITQWAQFCNNWIDADPSSWVVQPSLLIQSLLKAGRLEWVPHSPAVQDAGNACLGASTASAAAAAATTAAATTTAAAAVSGKYAWHHGPPDAELMGPCGSGGSSSVSNTAAAAAARVEQLRYRKHFRNQGRLLLTTAAVTGQLCTAPAAAAAAAGGVVSAGASHEFPRLLCGGAVEFSFFDQTGSLLEEKTTCHLQRHPILGAHDRLIRVSVDKSKLSKAQADLNNSEKRNSSKGRQEVKEGLALLDAFEAVLTYGLMLAGRHYSRIVQKDTRDSITLWLLAAASVCPEDAAAWQPINPAAARQLYGGFSSLPAISKQCARMALLVSDAVPIRVSATCVVYIPDIEGPTDAFGNKMTPAGATAAVPYTDGAGYISANLAGLVPAISAGEILGPAQFPHTPMQARMFDAHFGGVIAKGMLLPLNESVLPPGTVVLRTSQVKAPEAKTFWGKWSTYWQQLLSWAQYVHQHQAQQYQSGHHQHHQQQQSCQSSGSSSGARLTGVAGQTSAAVNTPDAAVAALACVHPQDRPWFQQAWYVYAARQLLAQSSSSSSSGGMLLAPPPAPCQLLKNARQQAEAASAACNHSGSSSSSSSAASGMSCSCTAMLEVVRRPADGAEKHTEQRIGKNLLMLLHHAGVPQDVFADWLKIELHKLSTIDTSWHAALAAAKAAGAQDVAHKLQAMIGLVPAVDHSQLQQQQPQHSASSSSSSLFSAGLASIDTTVSKVFKPDLALKMELHDIKVKQRQRLALLQLPIPTATDADAAVKAGVVEASPGLGSAAGVGIRLFGLPDPSCGGVPQGCVAVRPELVPPSGWAVIYRDPGIHPGDVRRVRVIAYPPQLLQLVPEGLSGAMFLPSVGANCLAAMLAGGDYDGDEYLLLWEPRVLQHFRAVDPAPYIEPAPSNTTSSTSNGSSGSGCVKPWTVPDAATWEDVEGLLTKYFLLCLEVSSLMGEAHNAWEVYADTQGLDSPHTSELVDIYYRALDAAKTGHNVRMPYEYQKALKRLPHWHSRLVKERSKQKGKSPQQQVQQAAAAVMPSRTSSSSRLIRSLWCQVQELPPVDNLDSSLLELDPDLVVQVGPDAVPVEVIQPLIDKWRLLHREWCGVWRTLLQEGPGNGRAANKRHSVKKQQLYLALKAKLDLELWGGVTTAATSCQSTGINVCSLNNTLLEASALYQAVYGSARELQARLQAMPPQQRAKYGNGPSVAMAWRVGGQYLRLLKVTRPLLVEKARKIQQLQQHLSLNQQQGSAGLNCYAGLLSNRVEIGSMQHPHYTAYAASNQQQQQRGGSGWAGRVEAVGGGGLHNVYGAVGGLSLR